MLFVIYQLFFVVVVWSNIGQKIQFDVMLQNVRKLIQKNFVILVDILLSIILGIGKSVVCSFKKVVRDFKIGKVV